MGRVYLGCGSTKAWGNLPAVPLALKHVHGQSGGDGQRSGGGHQNCSRRAILHDANLRMIFGMQMIGKALKRRVDELSGNDSRACQRDHRPPERLGACCDQQDGHNRQSDGLESQAPFPAQPNEQTGRRESKSPEERLILFRAHR
jgi:hypothetical protein